MDWEAQFGTLLTRAGDYLREGELPAQRLRGETGVSTSSRHARPLKHDRSSRLPLPHHFWRTSAKTSRAERTQGEARTHLKWSWRATLKSKASPRSTKPTPMKARRPGEGGRVRAGIAKQRRKKEGISRPAHSRARRLLQLDLGLQKPRYGTGDICSLVVVRTGLVKPAFKLI